VIYLDNSATTRPDDEVVDAMLPWLREHWGNPSSIYDLGRRARVAVEAAREEVAHLLGAHPAELIFTSGGTESNNAALKGSILTSGLADGLIYGSTEHHAVIHPAEELERMGIPVVALPVDGDGRIQIEALHQKLPLKAPLVSVMHANNETGAIQPVAAVKAMLPHCLVHTDAVQSFGKIPVHVDELGCDLASLSAHKIHGPKGIGALFIRKGLDFKAYQQGGGQERNRRGGTEAVSLIVGFQVAARRAVAEMQDRAAHMRKLSLLLGDLIAELIPEARINTPPAGALPNIVNVSFRDAARLDGDSILQAMDIRGIAVSNGSACVSGSLQPSHVLLAMGRPAAEARAAVRFSVSKDSTATEVRTAVEALASILAEMRAS
jgi:cysteine desulfurase